ncbi:hypothetical protein IM511_09200 [Erythrobacteraceae bacterium E2-1 Yellow Sea]|nr:hypothetical protein [Erythrobacteraceae bacterium E2-1 Yellow Sea]
MRRLLRTMMGVSVALALLSGCSTTSGPSPVEVTRFHDATQLHRISQGTIFVETAPGNDSETLDLAIYKAAVAQELARMGYTETSRDDARQVAQVRLEHFYIADEAPRRGPVSVGVGGSTGSYGSGVGVGIGINLGGGKPKDRSGTELGVMIRDKGTMQSLWEGRARLDVPRGHPLSEPHANAVAIAKALFEDFPGNDGETVEIEVSK